jgi:uncharacterized damage-inducible protein DinB
MRALVDYFRTMARNNLWSNHRLHAACAQLPALDYFRDRGAFFGSIHATLNHILAVDHHYITAIAGAAADGSTVSQTSPSLQELTEAQKASDQRLIRLCDELSEESLTTVVRWIGGDRKEWTDPVDVVLSHLFLHQIHHRGQVHNMLSVAGIHAPQLDEFLLSNDAPLREAEVRDLGLEK